MKKLIAVLVASLFAAVTYTAFADDKPVKSGPMDKPAGRAIDDGAVKSGGPSTKPGRAADDTKPAAPTQQEEQEEQEEDRSAVVSRPQRRSEKGRGVPCLFRCLVLGASAGSGERRLERPVELCPKVLQMGGGVYVSHFGHGRVDPCRQVLHATPKRGAELARPPLG